MDTRASRCAIWTLHAPPSREADINPNPKKGGYPAPHRVTFLTGPNRDFPKWRRHTGSLANERGRAKTASGAPRVNLFSRPYARARALLARPWSARCYGVARQREGSRQNSITRRLLTNRPCSSLVYEESDSKERLRVSNWIVQRLYNYAVKKTVELRLLTVFQHVVDPTRVRTVADKNSAVTPLDLRPTLADHVFKGNGIEV